MIDLYLEEKGMPDDADGKTVKIEFAESTSAQFYLELS